MRLGFCIVVIGLALATGIARAEPVREHCARVGTDDTLQPLPPALLGPAARLFGLERIPKAQALRGTVIRCMDGQVWACNYGANLPCGKARTSHRLPAAADWCRDNPNTDFIPAYIAGHDTIYRWRCADGVPLAGGPVARTDERGFLARYWKRLAL